MKQILLSLAASAFLWVGVDQFNARPSTTTEDCSHCDIAYVNCLADCQSSGGHQVCIAACVNQLAICKADCGQ
jgi:hypothetical protein